MILLVCDHCGQKGELPEDLAAEQDWCPRCGHALRDADDDRDDLRDHDPGRPAPIRRSVLIRRRRLTGMIVGGLIGAVGVPLLGIAGGPIGACVVGAVAGLMAGILFTAELCNLGGLYGSPETGDYSWLNPLTVGVMIIAPVVGAYFGSFGEDLTVDMLAYAALGGLVLAGWLGARLGEHLARRGAMNYEERTIGNEE